MQNMLLPSWIISVVIVASVLTLQGRLRVEAIDNFGPYVIRTAKFVNCKGPRNKECGTTTFHGGNITIVKLTVDVHSDCLVSHGRITASSLDEKVVKKLFNYNLENPCQHFFFGPGFSAFFNVTNKCVFKKNTYHLEIDINRYSQEFFGTKFFYGTYAFKTVFHNRVENFMCFRTELFIDRIEE